MKHYVHVEHRQRRGVVLDDFIPSTDFLFTGGGLEFISTTGHTWVFPDISMLVPFPPVPGHT